MFVILTLVYLFCPRHVLPSGEKHPQDELSRLDKLFHKIDGVIVADDLVSEEELIKWIQLSKQRVNNVDKEKEFKKNDVNGDGVVTWDEHANVFWSENNKQVEYQRHVLQDDERRFKLADEEGDLKLNFNEFSAFLHPEDHEHMMAHMLNQTIENLDKNNDHLISLDEYLADLWTGEGNEPKWLESERVEFSISRDRNNDGQMDQSEVKEWIFPREYGIKAQVKFLITESDANGDGKLSNEEMMLNFHLFLGSAEFGDDDGEDNVRDEL